MTRYREEEGMKDILGWFVAWCFLAVMAGVVVSLFIGIPTALVLCLVSMF